MKAIAITSRNENQPFEIIDIPKPISASNTLLIRNRFVGVNKGDAIRRKRSLFPPSINPPFILGFEGFGEVIEVGAGVTNFSVGDFVAYLIPGGAFAEIISVPADAVFVVPSNLSPELVAGSTCIGLTAIGLLQRAMPELRKGTALVHGATGSVGRTLLQIGIHRGFKMIATVSSPKDLCSLPLGVQGIPLSEADFSEAIMFSTAGRGIDIIFDCLGQAVLSGNLKALKPHGKWLYYGSSSGHSNFPGIDVLMKSLCVQGFVVFDGISNQKLWNLMIIDLLELLSSGVIKPDIHVISPEELTHITEQMDARQFRGKAVVDMKLLSY